jgi:hypothetical protein
VDVNQNHDGHQQVVVNWLRVGIYPWYTFDHTFMNVFLEGMSAHVYTYVIEQYLLCTKVTTGEELLLVLLYDTGNWLGGKIKKNNSNTGKVTHTFNTTC